MGILLNIPENILLFISGVGMLQGILLGVLLYFHPKSDKTVNRFLALFVFTISIPILMPVGQQLFSWQIIIFIEPFTVVFGPLLYLYVRSFKEVITWRKAWPHFIFFIVLACFSFVVYNELGSKYPPSHTVPKEVTQHPLSFVPVSIRLAQRLLYYFLALRALNAYQRSIRHLFSETSRINLNWVRYLINGYFVLVLLTIFFYSLILKRPENFSLWVLCLGAAVSIYIYIATFKGVSQVTLWQLIPGKTEETAAEIQQAEKLDNKPEVKRKSAISEARIDEIVTRVLNVVEKEKIYQETELTLQDLAGKLQLPAYQVSLAINEGMRKNFYDLINSYRVEEAKRLLLDESSKNYTILSIGFEAGFNSKTTFNTVFKKFTGQTPTEYRGMQKTAVLVNN
jgi:AraC-like DNA-binding protein